MLSVSFFLDRVRVIAESIWLTLFQASVKKPLQLQMICPDLIMHCILFYSKAHFKSSNILKVSYLSLFLYISV